MRIGKARLRWLLLVAVTFGACSPTRGCLESDFELAPESRLPKWFAWARLPRAGASVTMDNYIGPFGRTATFTLRNKHGRVVDTIVGTLQGDHPLTLELGHAPTARPAYEIVTAQGLTEIIEHKPPEPIFYITDDPEVRRKFGVSVR